jgi:hypothetical protein
MTTKPKPYKALRLTGEEAEALRKKAVEINQKLVRKGFEPVQDSQLAHIILKQSIAYADVRPDGSIWVRGD